LHDGDSYNGIGDMSISTYMPLFIKAMAGRVIAFVPCERTMGAKYIG